MTIKMYKKSKFRKFTHILTYLFSPISALQCSPLEDQWKVRYNVDYWCQHIINRLIESCFFNNNTVTFSKSYWEILPKNYNNQNHFKNRWMGCTWYTNYNCKKSFKLDVSEWHECPRCEYKGDSQMFHPFLIPSVIG